ncbi:helix-turn-helix transcriptional regulator [Halalkalibacter urbisdiaboli]|uniref:helix-turn-helix transcriptional regulator n=1 Tax=Halalkalibacter urbisdiaboli TaxID=1960589 RepID=UPI000B44DD09|nr:metalloregulator ArsR/SmtB family transcription factor [Halalkalibacter urbisdiaboli]
MVLTKGASSTRETILTMLKQRKEQTVSELAKDLGLTEMAVRRHLQGLEVEGLIEARIVRQSMGRPLHKYFLTEQGKESFPRNYGSLTVDFLKDLEELSGQEVITQLFEKRKERLQEKYIQTMNGTFEERVEALAKIQNENGYMVEVEKQEDGTFRFTEYNCPIAKVAKEYPVACSCEHELFQVLLNTDDIQQVSCVAKEDSTCCEYMLKKNK